MTNVNTIRNSRFCVNDQTNKRNETFSQEYTRPRRFFCSDRRFFVWLNYWCLEKSFLKLTRNDPKFQEKKEKFMILLETLLVRAESRYDRYLDKKDTKKHRETAHRIWDLIGQLGQYRLSFDRLIIDQDGVDEKNDEENEMINQIYD